MAARTAVLTDFSNSGNQRTTTLAAHTALKPAIVIETRKVPVGNQTVYEQSVKIVFGTVDSASASIPERISISAVLRMPLYGATADRDAILVAFRDIVASDEFANSIATQEWN